MTFFAALNDRLTRLSHVVWVFGMDKFESGLLKRKPGILSGMNAFAGRHGKLAQYVIPTGCALATIGMLGISLAVADGPDAIRIVSNRQVFQPFESATQFS